MFSAVVHSVVAVGSTADPPPIGQLIDIGGRKLHIHCTGRGSPVVIVENGGAAFSFDWELVQPRVSGFTRICTYDRAGYAWSDAGPEFDTFGQVAQDLHLLLAKAGVPGPYVLVGHSLGGMLVRYYQSKFPNDVLGMVLIDSSHEMSPQRVGLKVVRIPELTATDFLTLIDQGKANQPKNPEPDILPSTIFSPYDKLPARFQDLHLWALRKVLPLIKTWGANLHSDLSRLHNQTISSAHPLGNIPLAVLTASEFDVTRGSGITIEEARKDHLRLQDDLVKLSTNSRHVMVSNSGHEVYLYQPAVVVRSISAVFLAAKNRSQLLLIK